MRALLRWIAFCAIAIAFGVAGAAADAPAPRAVVDHFHNVLIDVMKHAGSLGFDGRYRQLEPEIERAFNLPLMIRLAVGAQWNSMAPGQQERLLEAFKRFTIATYAGRFDGFEGERFESRPEAPVVNGGVLVETRLVLAKGDPIQLNYLMREADGGWQIIDIFLSGTISELATRRAEFTSVLRRDGNEGLVTMLEHKVAELTPH